MTLAMNCCTFSAFCFRVYLPILVCCSSAVTAKIKRQFSVKYKIKVFQSLLMESSGAQTVDCLITWGHLQFFEG